MISYFKQIKIPGREILFQFLLHVLVFVFYTFDKNDPAIEIYQWFFFLNYAFWAFIINYVLLPSFYYKKKYIVFLVLILVVLAGALIVEEFVVEVIFFPDTRGAGFPGVFITLLAVMPVIVILSGFKFAWDALVKQDEVEKLKESIQESELQFLKSQINPHFLFNNLNNLYSYAIVQSKKTPKIILELSAVLRYMLYECKEPFVKLQKEVEQLENFTRLNELQIEDRGKVIFEKDNIGSQYRIAPLILIVFLENAFKHSTASLSRNILIEVKVKVDVNGVLHFNCLNNYQKTSNLESLDNGIGLANVKKRLELIYPEKHSLNITDSGEQYNVSLSIQL